MNNTHYENCNCHSNPPCSFCVDTFICDNCGNREYSEPSEERDLGWICENCQTHNETKVLPAYDFMTDNYKVYQGGRLIGALNVNYHYRPNGRIPTRREPLK